MEPALVVALLWTLFAATHIGLATEPVRGRLVDRLGEWRFILLFSTVASIAFSTVIFYFATHRFEGVAGLGLGQVPVVREILIGVLTLGIVSMTAALMGYPTSAYSMEGSGGGPARGFDRITRHGFFVGVSLLAGAHALLANHLVGTVGFAALAVFPLVGARFQDRKLLASRGPAFGAYLEATSTLPFAAIVGGRQKLVWKELPLTGMAVGVALAWGLSWVHESIFAYGGAFVILATVGGAWSLLFTEWRRQRHTEGSSPAGARS